MRRVAGSIVALFSLAVGTAGCPDFGGPDRFGKIDVDAASRPDGGGEPREHVVFMQGLAFCDQDDCSSVSKIRPGDTVTWVNNDTAFHEIAYGDFSAPPAREIFRSPPIQVGQSWSFTFEQPGDYEYYCANHKRIMNMAHIIVE
ncbi:MAG: hypothetical protein HY698_07760 [Deltaproteobacteria bacterium]|nr:hypothetical protein [Deltaproteobacteria bacterium]